MGSSTMDHTCLSWDPAFRCCAYSAHKMHMPGIFPGSDGSSPTCDAQAMAPIVLVQTQYYESEHIVASEPFVHFPVLCNESMT